MPYETVQEKVVQTKRVRVCARCRSRMPDDGKRNTMNTVGGVGGSLGASLGGSILLGSVLGPIGAIGGAIAGSIAGSRAGRTVSNKLADAVENNSAKGDDLCQSCRSCDSDSNQGSTLGGGHRLRNGDSWRNSNGEASTTSTAGEKIGEATSAAGRSINNGLSWMKQSVTSVVDNVQNNSSNNNDINKNPPPGGSNTGNQTSGFL